MASEKIVSFKNEGIKEVLVLRDRKARDASGSTVIDGIREVEAALQAGIPFQKVYLCPELFERKEAAALAVRLFKQKVSVLETSKPVFEKIAFGERLEGIVAIVRQPDVSLNNFKPAENPLLVIAEGVEKPGNLGAILRTCDAAGVDGLIVCDGRTDVYNPNVIRASLGAVFTVPVASCTNEQAFDFLKARKIQTVGTFPDAKSSYHENDYSKASAIILGSEQEGLSAFWRDHTDVKVTIPMSGSVNSLNVSATAAIVIYEAIRQRKTK